MAGQDVVLNIPANRSQTVQRPGDFLYVKFADRDIDVVFEDQETRVTMEAGDKIRPGRFKTVAITNPDPDRPARVVLTIGRGDYNRQIVQGDISVEPILRAADGTTKADTRQTLQIDLAPKNLNVETYQRDDLIKSGDQMEAASFLVVGPNGNLWEIVDKSGERWEFYEYDRNTLRRISSNESTNTGLNGGIAASVVYIPSKGFFASAERDEENIIYKVNVGSDQNFPTVKTFPVDSEFRSMEYLPADNTVVVTELRRDPDLRYQLVKLDTDFNRLLEVETSENWTKGDVLRWDAFNERLTIISRTEIWEINEGNLEFLSYLDGLDFLTFNTNVGGSDTVIFNQTMYGCDDDNGRLVARALVDFETKPEFVSVKQGCQFKAALYKQPEAPQTSAEIEVTELYDGVVLSGEVIKAAIEFFYRRKVPADYLDHLYQFDTTQDASGLSFQAVVTGNRSFSAFGIEDDFSIKLPGQVILTVDTELKLGDRI